MPSDMPLESTKVADWDVKELLDTPELTLLYIREVFKKYKDGQIGQEAFLAALEKALSGIGTFDY